MNPNGLKKYIERRIAPKKVRIDVLAVLLTERHFRNRIHRCAELLFVQIQKLFGKQKITTTVGSCQAPYNRWNEWCTKNNRRLYTSILNLECNYLLCLEIVEELQPDGEKDLLFGYNGYPNRYYRLKYRSILKELTN